MKTFGLKDFENTKSKYGNYKNDKFNKILDNEFANDLNDYQLGVLFNRCEYILLNSHFYCELAYKKNKSKREINMLANGINDAMRKSIIEIFIENHASNENEKKNFAIKFYIYQYEKINKLMSEILEYIVNEY